MGRVRLSGKVFGDKPYCPHFSSKREGSYMKGCTMVPSAQQKRARRRTGGRALMGERRSSGTKCKKPFTVEEEESWIKAIFL